MKVMLCWAAPFQEWLQSFRTGGVTPSVDYVKIYQIRKYRLNLNFLFSFARDVDIRSNYIEYFVTVLLSKKN